MKKDIQSQRREFWEEFQRAFSEVSSFKEANKDRVIPCIMNYHIVEVPGTRACVVFLFSMLHFKSLDRTLRKYISHERYLIPYHYHFLRSIARKGKILLPCPIKLKMKAYFATGDVLYFNWERHSYLIYVQISAGILEQSVGAIGTE